ncbi:MAG: hypothetical protein NTZ17_07225 [Phycisphaerae bacterium]|nr:hypothetical protein [Phycisphaerae bacterium]
MNEDDLSPEQKLDPQKGGSDTRRLVGTLFDQAEKNGAVDYVYTLVRVTGLERRTDPLLQLTSGLAQVKGKPAESLHLPYDALEEWLKLIFNLLFCSCGKGYNPFPFRGLFKGRGPDIVKPTMQEMVGRILEFCGEAGQSEMRELLDSCCGGLDSDTRRRDNPGMAVDIPPRLYELLNDSLTEYNLRLQRFRGCQRLYKLPSFEILELVVDDVRGLYGFQLHFSNGSSARFIRNQESTDGMNFSCDVSLSFWVGDLHKLTQEWRVGDRRLYEIGLPGRYNKFGYWKPLVYPAKAQVGDSYEAKARSMSQDRQVQGSLFYIMCTAHHVIEFVVYGDIDLPYPEICFGERLHLWKCPVADIPPNYRIYDGTFRLNSPDVDEVGRALSTISVVLNRLAFVYGGALHWRVKYDMASENGNSIASPTDSDLDLLRAMLGKYPSGDDARILDSSLDWYNRGVSARDVFASFLCYYTAVESITNAVNKRDADFQLDYKKEPKSVVDRRRNDCIERKYASLYSKNKVRFVTESYGECIQSLSAKARGVLDAVFGTDHPYIAILFDRQPEGDPSLSQIRNMITHGSLTLLRKDDEEIVRKAIYRMESIARELLLRLAVGLKPKDNLPQPSGQRSMTMSGYDPRTFLVANREDIFPSGADWRIRPEWCLS